MTHCARSVLSTLHDAPDSAAVPLDLPKPAPVCRRLPVPVYGREPDASGRRRTFPRGLPVPRLDSQATGWPGLIQIAARPSINRLSLARSLATAAASRSYSSSLMPADRRSVKTTSQSPPAAITRTGL